MYAGITAADHLGCDDHGTYLRYPNQEENSDFREVSERDGVLDLEGLDPRVTVPAAASVAYYWRASNAPGCDISGDGRLRGGAWVRQRHGPVRLLRARSARPDRKSTRLNSSHIPL